MATSRRLSNGFLFFAEAGNFDVVGGVTGKAGDGCSLSTTQNGDAAAAEAADNGETVKIPANDQGADFGRGRRCSGEMSSRCERPRDWRGIWRCRGCVFGGEIRVPATKYIRGPKLHAAGAPRKWRPGTDDSRPAWRWGKPSVMRRDLTISGERNGYRRRRRGNRCRERTWSTTRWVLSLRRRCTVAPWSSAEVT